MNNVVLSEFETCLCQAHQQTRFLEQAYRDCEEQAPCGIPARERQAELIALRRALNAELERRNLLPMGNHPEQEGIKKLVANITDMVSDTEHTLLYEEERRLLELCHGLQHAAESLSQDVRQGIAATARRMKALETNR